MAIEDVRAMVWDPPQADPVWRPGPQTFHNPPQPTIGDARGLNVKAGEVGLFLVSALDKIDATHPDSLRRSAWAGDKSVEGYRGRTLAVRPWTKKQIAADAPPEPVEPEPEPVEPTGEGGEELVD